MKKILLVTILLYSVLSVAQTNRFIYQVTMKPNTNDKTEEYVEKAYLDISPDKSIFYAEKRLLRDSLMRRMLTTNDWDRTQFQDTRSKIDFTVEKDLAAQTITFKQRIARDNYSYEEDRKMVWKILPETMSIGNYKVQKAETTFAGRIWHAWFAAELPFQDGPYKFSGLPGLIVKVEDADGDYSFDLEQSKKIAEIPTFEERGSTINLKRKDFNAQQAKFKKDPVAGLSGRGGGGRGGWTIDPKSLKEAETRMKDEIAKNNNPIELE